MPGDMEIAISSIKVFAGDGTMDMEELNFTPYSSIATLVGVAHFTVFRNRAIFCTFVIVDRELISHCFNVARKKCGRQLQQPFL